MQYKREIEIKYVRHPFRKDGSQDTSVQEKTSWYTTIYDNGRKLTDQQAKDLAVEQFLMLKFSYIELGKPKVTKKTKY